MKKLYLVNKVPVTFQRLIELAKEYGYESSDGLYMTSEAAQVLRDEAGATVEVNNDLESL